LVSYRERIKPYFVKENVLSNKAGEDPDNNGVLYTGTHFVILDRLGFDYTDVDREIFETLSKDITARPGLIRRGKHKLQHTAHDDYVGWSAAAFFLGYKNVARSFYDYGKENKWIYNHTGVFTWKQLAKSWFYRIPGVIQHFKIMAEVGLSYWDQVLWGANLYSTTRKHKGATSGRILDWIKIQAYRKSGRRNWLCEKAINHFERDIRNRYPRLMGEVFEIYFHKTHPFALYMQNKV